MEEAELRYCIQCGVMLGCLRISLTLPCLHEICFGCINHCLNSANEVKCPLCFNYKIKRNMAIDSIAIQTAETISGFQYKIDSINPKSILCPGPKHPNKLPTNDEDKKDSYVEMDQKISNENELIEKMENLEVSDRNDNEKILEEKITFMDDD